MAVPAKIEIVLRGLYTVHVATWEKQILVWVIGIQ